MTVSDIKDMSPNSETIRLLERLLEHAKSGELRTAVMISGWDDDSWSSHWSVDERNTRRRMIGEMAMLYHDMVANQLIDEGDGALARAIND